jgi:hypothetical protein
MAETSTLLVNLFQQTAAEHDCYIVTCSGDELLMTSQRADQLLRCVVSCASKIRTKHWVSCVGLIRFSFTLNSGVLVCCSDTPDGAVSDLAGAVVQESSKIVAQQPMGSILASPSFVKASGMPIAKIRNIQISLAPLRPGNERLETVSLGYMEVVLSGAVSPRLTSSSSFSDRVMENSSSSVSMDSGELQIRAETHPVVLSGLLSSRDFLHTVNCVSTLYAALLLPLSKRELEAAQEAVSDALRLFPETHPSDSSRNAEVSLRVLQIIDTLLLKDLASDLGGGCERDQDGEDHRDIPLDSLLM